MKIRSTYLSLSLFLASVAAPLSAASPQEIYAELSEAPAVAPQLPENRAQVLPALGYLPIDTEAFVVVPHMGKVLPDMEAADADDEEQIRMLRSVDNMVLSAGVGSAEAAEVALSMMIGCAEMLQMDDLKQWAAVTKEREGEVISKVFAELTDARRVSGIEMLQKMHFAPVYAAISALPGAEADFAKIYGKIQKEMAELAEMDADWQADEWQGFKGVRTTQDKLFAEGIIATYADKADAGQQEALVKLLAEREVHLLVKQEEGVILMVFCENPADISLPASPEQSLLNTPALAGAYAHLDSLVSAGWMSANFTQSFIKVSRYNSRIAALATAFEALSAADAANAAIYTAAAQGTKLIEQKVFPVLAEVTVPTAVQVWRKDGALYIDATSDAMGGAYQPGELRFVSKADDFSCVVYAEMTEVTSPYFPDFTGVVAAAYDMAKGFIITLPEREQDEVAPQLSMAQMLMPDVLALGAGLQTVKEGLSMPCALVVENVNAVSPVPAVAFYAGVKNRAALAEGWKQLETVANQAGAKFGMPNVSAMLPIYSEPMGAVGMSYMLALPLLPGLEPQVSLNDQNFVVGTSSALNRSMLSHQGAAVPFCGAVFSLRVPGMLQYLKRTGFDNGADSMLSGISAVHAVSRTQDGVSILRVLVKML